MNQYLQEKKLEFDKVIEFFRKDISSLRTGRANVAMLDGITVEAYGIKNPLVSVGNISTTDAKSIVITPWDKGVLKDVEKAIMEANLGLGIVNEGDKIRLTVSPMTEEVRKELVKKLNEKNEHAKVSARGIREIIKKSIEEAEKDGAISEDDSERFMKEMDEEVKKINDELKGIRDKKEAEIMTI
ncbi:MAG: ribosome recycling factor [Patescibacteria group bacterium]|jgi:ribosome recycling factor